MWLFVSQWLGNEGTVSTYINRTGTWRQKLIQRTWKGTDYWFPLHGLHCLISYTTQSHQPQGCPKHNWLGCPTSMLIKEEPTDLTMVQFYEGIFSIEICWEGMFIFTINGCSKTSTLFSVNNFYFHIPAYFYFYFISWLAFFVQSMN